MNTTKIKKKATKKKECANAKNFKMIKKKCRPTTNKTHKKKMAKDQTIANVPSPPAFDVLLEHMADLQTPEFVPNNPK